MVVCSVLEYPFHDNTRTPSAHLYDQDEHGASIFCYAEHKLFMNIDIYRTFLPNVDLKELAQALYDRLPQEEKDYIQSNVNSEYELPELPYIDDLKKFQKREITFKQLIEAINMKVPLNETSILIDQIYSLPTIKMPDNKNKYLYYINHFDTEFKVLSAISVLTQFGNKIPDFLREYLQHNGDCIIIPNRIGKVIYSLTLRNISGKKQFLKIGDVSHSLYNLGHLPEDFGFGIPLLLVEGNLDCEVMKQIYPYTVASLTATLSTNQIQLISHLTDKVIIAYDTDEAGESGFWIVRKKLMELGVTVKRFKHNINLHDAGDLIDLKMTDPEEYDYLIKSYGNQINGLL